MSRRQSCGLLNFTVAFLPFLANPGPIFNNFKISMKSLCENMRKPATSLFHHCFLVIFVCLIQKKTLPIDGNIDNKKDQHSGHVGYVFQQKHYICKYLLIYKNCCNTSLPNLNVKYVLHKIIDITKNTLTLFLFSL